LIRRKDVVSVALAAPSNRQEAAMRHVTQDLLSRDQVYLLLSH
jgi:hypothetical protein